MSDHKQDDSFREMNFKDKLLTIVGVTLLILLVSGFVIGLYFFGMAGVFKLLGVQYQSGWSLVVFVLSFYILGFVVELFTRAIYELFSENITGTINKFLIRISFEAISNWIVLFIVDEFMRSITLSPTIEIIIASLIALIEIAFDHKDLDAKK
ncbi:YrvL family regulatory protein [Niallia sp. Krafla_26]|uniref:YrvL family regulatory protein n=1 Tax=Niallia sp. Krafla_26 TaxID=3064703 RepID=UPI003D179067